MESTLAVADKAYNSGRRSRTSSFVARANDNLSVADPALSPSQTREFPLFRTHEFRTHERHASDVSDNSPNVAAISSEPSLPFDLGNLTSSSAPHNQPSAPNIQNLDCDLDEAFKAAQFMHDSFPSGFQDEQSMPTQDFFPRQSYYRSLDQYAGIDQGAHNHSQTTYNHALLQPNDPFYSALGTEDNGLHSEHTSHSTLQLNFDSLSHRSSSSNMAHDPSNLGQSSPSGHFEMGQLPDYSVLQSSNDSGAQPQMMLEVPANDGMGQGSLGVPSPYSDTASFDATAYGDLHSPSIDPLALSRTNSLTSQHQQQQHQQQQPQHLDMSHMSNPNSPYSNHIDYGHMSTQPPASTFDGPYADFTHGFPQYGYLQSMDDTDQFQHSQSYQEDPPLQPSHAGEYDGRPAPDIAIDPPTPGSHSFMSRAAQSGYAFPQQQVPLITTTNVSQHEQQPGSLGVERNRGRSHSDSRLMVSSALPRSPSYSSFDSSSSLRAQSRSRSRGSSTSHQLGVDVANKSGDTNRRASWSGAQEHTSDGDSSEAVQGGKGKIQASFVCPVHGCNKSFTRAYNLRSHQRTHTNERPFLCEVCGKGFARQHDRKRHEKLHTNEKPFSCPGCKKKFARMDALSRHFKSETGKDCIVGYPEYEHFLLDTEDGQ